MFFWEARFDSVSELWDDWRTPQATRKGLNRYYTAELFHWILRWSEMMRKQTHYSQEWLIIHSACLLLGALPGWQSRCTFGGVWIYEAAVSSVIHPVVAHRDAGWQMSMSRHKRRIGSSASAQVDMMMDRPLSTYPTSVLLAINLSSHTLWTNIPSCWLFLHASPLPRCVLIIQEMSQCALLLHPINNTLRSRGGFDGGRRLMMWLTIHRAALFMW